MHRPRSLALAGLAAALLCNYWVLEGLLADRYDLESSWISDLATRSESSGWRFVALGVIAGIAIAAFAALLLASVPRAERPMRGGLIALLTSGLCMVVASAAPLDCAEGLEPACTLAYDPLDVIHATATAAEIATTLLAFALIGAALLPSRTRFLSSISRQTARSAERVGTAGGPGTAGWVTLALGAAWLVLTALTGVSYLSDGVDSIKGLLQRGDQIIFGIWLALLGFWARDW